MQEDKMVGWHHQLDAHEFEQALAVDDGQKGLGCCSPWGHKGSDTNKRQNCKVTREVQCSLNLTSMNLFIEVRKLIIIKLHKT